MAVGQEGWGGGGGGGRGGGVDEIKKNVLT